MTPSARLVPTGPPRLVALSGPRVGEHRGQLEKLARRGTASVVGAGFSAVFGVLLVVIVTNGFTPSVAGILFAATAVFLILEAVTLLGTDTGLVRWLPSHLTSGRADDLSRTLVVAAVPVLTLSVGTAVALHLTAPLLAPLLVGASTGPESGATSAIMAAMLQALSFVLPVAALHDLALAGTRGMGSMRPTVAVENIGRLGLQAGGVLGVYLLGGGPSALAVAWALPYLPGLLASGWWLRRLLVRSTRAPAQATSPAPMAHRTGTASWSEVAREFWGFTAPRAIARITQTALKRSDIVLVAALASPADAALYTAATRFVVLGQLFVQSVQQALSPHLSALFARGEKAAASSVFQAATVWSMIAAWPLYLVLAAHASVLMGIFGPGYAVASDVVLILSLTMLLATACGPVDSVLLMAGRSWLSLRNSVLALVVNIGLNLVLIPLDGIRGAAIAWSVAIVVRNLLPLFQVRRHLGLWPGTRASALVGLTSLATFGTVDVLVLAVDLPLTLDAGLVLVATLAYLTAIWSLRGPLGLDAFRSALRRRAKHPDAG